MVLIDYNGIAVGSILGQLNRGETLSENLVKHIILNNIRTYRNKFSEEEYGKIILCVDSFSWRKEIFPEYKANRKSTRDNDKNDWAEIYRLLDVTTNDIRKNFPYAVLRVDRCEADDIIGTLAREEANKFGGEKIAIISADKDFIQLHALGNVVQYSPMQNKMVVDSNPGRYLFDHILKGDSSDGVPNCNSPDNTFTDKIRQKPMTQKMIDKYYEDRESMPPEVYRNFVRNTKMIDLKETPLELQDEIVALNENYKYPNKSNILNYLIENKMKMLIECASEF